MRSRNDWHAATAVTVATVNWPSTETLISLGVSVDGDVTNTSLSVAATRADAARDPLHSDAAWTAISHVARAFISVLEPSGPGSRRHATTRRRVTPATLLRQICLLSARRCGEFELISTPEFTEH